MAGGADFRPAPGARRVGRLDLGAEEHALDWPSTSPRPWPTCASTRRGGPGPMPRPSLCSCSRCCARPSRRRCRRPCSWYSGGSAGASIGGATSCPSSPGWPSGAAAGLFSSWVERTYVGAQGADFDLRVHRAPDRRRPGRLVLRRQARLARRPQLHLPALDGGRRGLVAVAVPAGRARGRPPRSGSFGGAPGARWPPSSSSSARSSRRSASSTSTARATHGSGTTGSTCPTSA